MNKTTRNTTIALAIGSAFSIALPTAQADGNPFAMQTLQHGYMVADAGKAMDGKCGADKAMDKVKDGKCGADKKTMSEDASSSAMEPEKDAATGKAKDGKCGEGKCGANKGKAKPAKPDA